VTLSEDCFTAWAPDHVTWSAWAKPVAFVQAADLNLSEPAADTPLPSIPIAVGADSAVVVDLPGAEAVSVGLALAERGLRPIPLFNGTSGPSAVVDVRPITRALVQGAERLKRGQPAPDAAPAFLLDSRRNDPAIVIRPGSYDNRWVTLPQDFPSGALLASRGFHHATLIQRDDLSVRPDLAHVLRRWQDHGMVLRVIDLTSGRIADNVSVPKPSGFKLAWYAAIALLGLRRSNVGGFGSMIPDQVARSGFYG
jgi:hypothetical protein